MEKFLIKTSRLLIRNFRETDLISFHQYRSNPEITRYQGCDVFSVQEAREFINAQINKSYGVPGEWIQYAIERISDGQLAGDCAIFLEPDEPGTAELGITISDTCQRNGYAKETMRGLMNLLFHEKNIRRIVETVDAENIASVRLIKSLSFRQEGYFKENVFFKGKWGSELQFALLKKEWEQLMLSLPG